MNWASNWIEMIQGDINQHLIKFPFKLASISQIYDSHGFKNKMEESSSKPIPRMTIIKLF